MKTQAQRKIEAELKARANVTLSYLADGKLEDATASLEKLNNGVALYFRGDSTGCAEFMKTDDFNFIVSVETMIKNINGTANTIKHK